MFAYQDVIESCVHFSLRTHSSFQLFESNWPNENNNFIDRSLGHETEKTLRIISNTKVKFCCSFPTHTHTSFFKLYKLIKKKKESAPLTFSHTHSWTIKGAVFLSLKCVNSTIQFIICNTVTPYLIKSLSFWLAPSAMFTLCWLRHMKCKSQVWIFYIPFYTTLLKPTKILKLKHYFFT